MRLNIKRLNLFWVLVSVLFAWAAIQQWSYQVSSEKGARKAMKTYYLGRFCIAVPALMAQMNRSSTVRFTDVEEVNWPRDGHELARSAEWERLLEEVKQIEPPEYASKAFIKADNSPPVGKWAKGIFFHNGQFSFRGAEWKFLVDGGPVGVWLTAKNVPFKKELEEPKTYRNLVSLALAYQPYDQLNLQAPHAGSYFYLQNGAINLPYLEQEEAIARFEGHPLDLSLFIEMTMDSGHYIETTSLISGTRAMLAAALLVPNGGVSKIRLQKREVAGMPGEEAVLRIREGDRKDLLFQWHFNGRDDSGE